jgi:hypothetical protein
LAAYQHHYPAVLRAAGWTTLPFQRGSGTSFGVAGGAIGWVGSVASGTGDGFGITDSSLARLFEGSPALPPFSTSITSRLAATLLVLVVLDVRCKQSLAQMLVPSTSCQILKGGLSRTEEAEKFQNSCLSSSVACQCYFIISEYKCSRIAQIAAMGIKGDFSAEKTLFCSQSMS